MFILFRHTKDEKDIDIEQRTLSLFLSLSQANSALSIVLGAKDADANVDAVWKMKRRDKGAAFTPCLNMKIEKAKLLKTALSHTRQALKTK